MNAEVLMDAHIVAGIVSLMAGVTAATTKIVPSLAAGAHRVHIRAGQLFTLGMTLVFVTAVPLGILNNDVFIVCVAVFSYYLALSGWRAARNRTGRAGVAEWAISLTMLVAGVGMLVAGVVGWVGNAVTLAVFGAVGAGLAVSDIRAYRAARRGSAEVKPAKTAERIARHLSLMLGGVIATITAALVVNVTTSPAWIAWLLPLAVVTPLIVVMNRRVLKG